MEIMKKSIQKWGKGSLIAIFLVFAFISGTFSGFSHTPSQTKVLGASIHVTPTPTFVPSPTVAPITIINNIIVPTTVPTNVLQVTPTQSPIIIVVTPTPTPVTSPTQTPSLTPMVSVTPTPTPVPQTVEVAITYAGEHADSTYTVSITGGESAWQAVQDAVGLANIHYTDYGGSLGIFITGFNGVDASSNQYYDFQINGTSSTVGVSSYTVQNRDTLKFVLTSF